MKTSSRRSLAPPTLQKNTAPPLVILCLMLVMGLGWGLDYALLKIVSEAGLPSLGVTAVLGIGGGLILLTISWARGQSLPLTSQHLRFYAFCGILSNAGPLFLLMLVARHIPASVLAIVVTMTPVFTYVFARLTKLEDHSWRRMAGIGFGLAAALLLIVPKTSLPNADMRIWVGIAFVVPVLYASYHVFATSQRPDGLDSMQAAAGTFLSAGILVLPAALVLPTALGQNGIAFLFDPWTQGHWAMVALLVIYSCLGMLFFVMLKLAGPVVVSLTNFIGVIAGVGWGIMIFGERPTPWVLGSLGLLVVALALTISFGQIQEVAPE